MNKVLEITSPKGMRRIGGGSPCFVVVEVSCNHLQQIDKAKEIFRAAADAGADAVKLQTYTPDTITMNSRKEWFLVGGDDNPDSWQKKSLYELYGKAYTPWEWHAELKQLAEEQGMVFFSSPFDESAVDFLETLNVSLYKIASYELTHIPLLRKVAATKKPVIMSVGFNSLEETALSVAALRKGGASEIALLHCLNTYAEAPRTEDAHLATIRDLAERFDVVSGFSDNNAGIEYPMLAVAAGASIIEKHLVADHNDPSFDSRFSLDPREMRELVARIRTFEKAVGVPHYGPVNDAEKYNLRWRRSIFIVQDIPKGELLTSENIRVIRPSFGMEPKYYSDILGKRASRNLEAGDPLSQDMIN